MYKISIIIPVYNAEKTIKRCLTSIINQTIGFDNLEIILVNDCSTDKSKEIIEEYSLMYNNIIGIHLNENHGFPGYGRNLGIKTSSADYIMFIDNDDEYDLEICERLYNELINNNTNLVSCDFKDIDDDTNYFYRGNPINKKEIHVKQFNKSPIYFKDILIWNKIFKKSIILKNNIKFVEDRVNEDSLFSIEYFLNIDEIIYIDNYYGYIHHTTGNNLSLSTYDYTSKIIQSYYEIYNLIKRYKKNINLNIIFDSRIQTSVERCVLMPEGDFKLIKDILEKLFVFTEEINLKTPKSNNIFVKIIYKLIFSKHFSTATSVTWLLNKIAKQEHFKNFYRKHYIKN